MTLDQLLADLGLFGSHDPDGTLNYYRPPNPVPALGAVYAVIEVLSDATRAQLQDGAQDRGQTVQVGVFGSPDTLAGRQQLVIVMAHLRFRARDVTAHLGVRLRECLPGDPLPVRRDVGTASLYAYQRYALSYLAP